MADDPKKPDQPPVTNPLNRPQQPLKATVEGNPPDPAARVADPANPGPTNPGPGANPDQPAFPTPPTTPPVIGTTRNAPLQPVVPAPSEQTVPGPVGRPDPSKTPEERQATADNHIEAHATHPGNAFFEPPILEQTVDGEPHRANAPAPPPDDGPITHRNFDERQL